MTRQMIIREYFRVSEQVIGMDERDLIDRLMNEKIVHLILIED